ncbi:MAG: class I fructose-bisphosphate aldolase [Thermomicrobiales bacterium]
MFTGIDRRMSRMFASDGKSLCLAFDHGNWGMNYAGMADPAKTLREVTAVGLDAVLTTIGQALEFGDIIKNIGLAINMDDFALDPTPIVDQAVAIGADFGKVICFTGEKGSDLSIRKAHLLSAICRERNLPLMIEPIPGSFEMTDQHTPENIGVAGRMAAEIGADIVKMQYTGSRESFQQVIDPIFRPVIVLGGPNRGDIRGVLSDVHGAIACGAVGIAIGRNIWAHETPAKVISAMNVIIHGGGTVDEAMRELA